MHYHFLTCLPAVNKLSWREPKPGSSVTITCDNQCVILSYIWRSPQRCVITGDCHNLVPSHSKASELTCAAVNLQNITYTKCLFCLGKGHLVWSYNRGGKVWHVMVNKSRFLWNLHTFWIFWALCKKRIVIFFLFFILVKRGGQFIWGSKMRWRR